VRGREGRIGVEGGRERERERRIEGMREKERRGRERGKERERKRESERERKRGRVWHDFVGVTRLRVLQCFAVCCNALPYVAVHADIDEH